MKIDKEEIILLASLLHDIGKLSQRASKESLGTHAEVGEHFIKALKSFWEEIVWIEIKKLVRNHHEIPTTKDELILQIADKLSAIERRQEVRERISSKQAALVAITSKIKLHANPPTEKYYQPYPLQIKKEILFPTEKEKVEEDAYKTSWEKFFESVKRLSKYQDCDFVTLYYLLKKFVLFVPSATPWEKDSQTVPDISLFDHSKITCAIAACLNKLSENDLSLQEMKELVKILKSYKEEDFERRFNSLDITKKPLFLLLRGDIAGIQKFIYSITRPEPEKDTRKTAKRLRGRSFFVTLLTEVIADWIIRRIELPVTNILFCGGGRFDLLLPIAAEEKIPNLLSQLNKWLLEEFNGELSLQIAVIEICPKDFLDLSFVYQKLEDTLAKRKYKKFLEISETNDFFTPEKSVPLNVCRVCLVSQVKDNEICCIQCKKQEEIGNKLPKIKYIVFLYGEPIPKEIFKEELKRPVEVTFKKLGVYVYLVSEEEIKTFCSCIDNEQKAVIYVLNPESDFILENLLDFKRKGKSISFGFKFIANAVPKVLKEGINVKDEEVKKGDILSFEEIAELSKGAKYLGILKMDIDYLGAIFALGLKKEEMSFSRISTLSTILDLFFGGWLNVICRELTEKWIKENKNWQDAFESLYYILYAGGDDLLIIGPWDAIIELSYKIQQDFTAYTSFNENFHLSGGICFVKPLFPIQRFVHLAGQALERSKTCEVKGFNEKNRLTLFDRTIKWSEFKEVFNFAEKMISWIREEKMPRGFVYFLHNLEKETTLMWVPYLFYNVARRIRDEKIKAELIERTPVFSNNNSLRIITSYVSLKTRGG